MPANDRSRVSNFSSPSLSTPSPVQFSRAICGDLGQAERREWWIANGRAGYAGGTIAGSLTRRYHGLLIAPVGSPLERGFVLAKADATLICGSRSWPLFTNCWRSGVVSPAGHVWIGSFHLDYSVPVWTYDFGNRQIEARVWMEPGAHTTYAAWPAAARQRCARKISSRRGLSFSPTISTTMGQRQSAASSPRFKGEGENLPGN